MRSLLVVILEEIIERIEPPVVLVGGLEVALTLGVGLRSTNRTKRVLDVVVGELLLEGVLGVAVFVAPIRVESGVVVGDRLEDSHVFCPCKTWKDHRSCRS